jgi:predicted membrane GTPase involved in stress response
MRNKYCNKVGGVPKAILGYTLPLFLVTTLDYNDYVGRIAIGRIFSGKVAVGENVSVCKLDGSVAATPKSIRLRKKN